MPQNNHQTFNCTPILRPIHTPFFKKKNKKEFQILNASKNNIIFMILRIVEKVKVLPKSHIGWIDYEGLNVPSLTLVVY